jgi:hypothetical protein
MEVKIHVASRAYNANKGDANHYPYPCVPSMWRSLCGYIRRSTSCVGPLSGLARTRRKVAIARWHGLRWHIRKSSAGWAYVLDLTTLGYVLRMRWSWLASTDLERCRSTLPLKEERLVWVMFQASTTVHVSNDHLALFWRNPWLDGSSIQSLTPNLCNAVRIKTRAS